MTTHPNHNTADQSGADERMHSVIAGALFDLMGMLTSQNETVILGSHHEASVAVQMIQKFANSKGLHLNEADVRGWQAALASTQPAPVTAQDISSSKAWAILEAIQIVMDARNSIGAGSYAEQGAMERDRVSPYLDGIEDELRELLKSIDATPQPFPAPAVQAIVPQVVQAPSDEAVKTATNVFQSIFFNAGLDGESSYEQMQRAMHAAIISSEYVAAPIVATPKLTECRHCGFMVALNQPPADSPVVATVPSEPVAFCRVEDVFGNDSMLTQMGVKRGDKLFTHAAPSHTEQASDVRNAALEEAATQCTNTMMMNVDSYCGATASLCAERIRALKSAPADKGNAQDEVIK